jgi:glycosyltransferase involved in cell wall biosynthesis
MAERITFLLFTYNEARRIEYVLRCFQPFGKIVVMDNHSTDDTAAIARRYGAEVYEHDHPGYVEEERVAANALSKVTTDWVYWAFCDEILPKPLLIKLQQIAEEDQYRLVNIHRKNLHYGLEQITFDSGGRTPRFFRKGFVDFSNNPIHGMGRFTGTPDQIHNLPIDDDYSIYHCSTYNLRKFEIAHSAYSSVEAEMVEGFSPISLLWGPVKWFLKHYVKKGGWRGGWGSFILVMQYCFFYFNVQAKAWEKAQGITLESIENKYDLIKERLIK